MGAPAGVLLILRVLLKKEIHSVDEKPEFNIQGRQKKLIPV